MCQIVLDYFIVSLSKYLQMMVSYHIFKEDSGRVANDFEQFNTLYGSFANIFKEVTKEDYKPGCKKELKEVGTKSKPYRNSQTQEPQISRVHNADQVTSLWARVLALVEEDKRHSSTTKVRLKQ